MLVYIDILEFYTTAIRFSKQRRTALRLLSEALNENLPSIVKTFLYHAARLQDSIQNATLGVVGDIQRLLLDDKSNVLLMLYYHPF